MIRYTREFFRRRLIRPLLDFLSQGITPHKLALAIAFGFGLGTFPVLGSTILLCTLFGFAFRLNIPAIQLINGFVYPLQLMLYIPFFHIGAWIFRTEPIPFSLNEIFTMLANDVWQTIHLLWSANLRAVGAWSVTVIPAALILYYISRVLFDRVLSRRKKTKDPVPVYAED